MSIQQYVISFVDSARCPDSTEVILDPSCHRTYNVACSYTCKTGYQPTNTSDGNYVTCTTSSAWDRPLSSLCEKPKCPATIPHGNISSQYCSREYNKVCRYYSCDSGYVKLEDHWSCSSPERLSHCKLMRFKLIENQPMKVYAWTLLTHGAWPNLTQGDDWHNL